MNFREFADRYDLAGSLNLDSEQKVELGHFEHTIRPEVGSDMVVVTLSKDLSLFLSGLTHETRSDLVQSLFDELSKIESDVLHLVHKQKHLLVSRVQSKTNARVLHIEQRA